MMAMHTGQVPTTAKTVSITRRWKKGIACTCSHGYLVSQPAAEDLFEWRDEYKPNIVVHLGDFIDTTAWRSGAAGTPDECRSGQDDFNAAQTFLDRLRPNLVFVGNHDHRPYTKVATGSALVADLAQHCVDDIRKLVRDRLKAELVEGYDISRSWRDIGGTLFAHGWMYGEHAIRDHVEAMGRPVCIGHVHRLESQTGRVHGAPQGWSAGYLGEPEQMSYAHNRRSTLRWTRGWLDFEYTDNDCRFFPHKSRVELGTTLPTAQCAAG